MCLPHEEKKMFECLPSRRGLPGFFHKIHLIANVCDLFPQWIWNISEFEFNLNFIFDAATVANYYRRATTGTKQTKQNETHNKMNFFHEFTNSFVLDFWNRFLVLLFVVFLMVLEQFRVAVLYARVCDSLSFYFGHLGPTPEKASIARIHSHTNTHTATERAQSLIHLTCDLIANSTRRNTHDLVTFFETKIILSTDNADKRRKKG